MYSLWNNENIIPLVRVCISVQSKAKNGHMKQRWPNYIPSQETQRCEKLKVKGQKNISHITSIQKWADMATVQFSLSHVQLFATPLTAARQASPSITNSQSLFKFMSIESVMPSNHLILCHPLLLLPSVFPNMRVFSNKSVLLWGSQSIGASASASICHEVMGLNAMILVFWMLSFKPAFSFSSFTFIKRLFILSAFCH